MKKIISMTLVLFFILSCDLVDLELPPGNVTVWMTDFSCGNTEEMKDGSRFTFVRVCGEKDQLGNLIIKNNSDYPAKITACRSLDNPKIKLIAGFNTPLTLMPGDMLACPVFYMDSNDGVEFFVETEAEEMTFMVFVN